ncbi:MAG: glycosyltransferase [Chitinispirillaceae bacterium]|nr:glycosyltransferase [Chitinispirillaceae bacterium]
MNMQRTEAGDGVDSLPKVSVVIISKGNRGMLERVLASISRTDYPQSKLQCVVLEETDDPQPPQPWVEYYTIAVKHRGFGFARNRALSYARNPIVLFTDDDCTVAPDWIRELVGPLMDSQQTVAVGGAVFVPPCGVVGQCENIIGFPGGGVKYVHAAGGKTVRRETFSTCNCAIRRSAIDGAGGFDESMKYGGEDERISRHIAGQGNILYHPKAIVHHQPRDSLCAVFAWFVRRGFAEVHHAMTARRSSRSIAAGFIQNAVVVRLAVVALFAAVSGLDAPLFFPVIVIYYGVLLWKFRWARRYYPSFATLLMVPVVRTVMDIGRDCGIVKGLLAAKASRPKLKETGAWQ